MPTPDPPARRRAWGGSPGRAEADVLLLEAAEVRHRQTGRDDALKTGGAADAGHVPGMQALRLCMWN